MSNWKNHNPYNPPSILLKADETYKQEISEIIETKNSKNSLREDS